MNALVALSRIFGVSIDDLSNVDLEARDRRKQTVVTSARALPVLANMTRSDEVTQEERKNIVEVGFTKRKYYLFMLMLFCGCRPSEAASATGADIELHDGFNVLHVKGTKTALSDRFVPIPDILFNYIKNTPKNEYIAVYENGNMITRDNRRRCWQSFVREVNLHMGAKTYRNKLVPPLPLADDLVPYCLRHEYCTELARRGVDIRVAQKLMGHSNIRMTANVYTNLEAYDVLSVADMLDATKSATQSATLHFFFYAIKKTASSALAVYMYNPTSLRFLMRY